MLWLKNKSKYIHWSYHDITMRADWIIYRWEHPSLSKCKEQTVQLSSIWSASISIMYCAKDSLESSCLESMVKSGLPWLSEDNELMSEGLTRAMWVEYSSLMQKSWHSPCEQEKHQLAERLKDTHLLSFTCLIDLFPQMRFNQWYFLHRIFFTKYMCLGFNSAQLMQIINVCSIAQYGTHICDIISPPILMSNQ